MILSLSFFILFIIFVAVSFYRLSWGVALTIVLLPSYLWRFDFFGWPTTFLELIVLALFFIWLFKDKRFKKINFLFQKNSFNPFPKILRIILSFWLLASVLAWLTNPTFEALGLWRAYFLEPMMFLIVFVYEIKEKKDLHLIKKALALLLAWLFVVTMYQYFTNWNFIAAYNPPNVLRLTGPYPYPNALALLTAPLASFFFMLWIKSKDKLKNWYYLLSFIFALVLSVLAVSQGAILAILASIMIWLVLDKKIRKFSIPILAVAAITGAFLFPVAEHFNNFKNQFEDPQLNLESSSLEIRIVGWQETQQFLADNFFFGAGIGGFQDKIADYHQIEWLEIYLYPHSIFLNFWTEMGLIGMLVFVVLMIYVGYLLKELFRQKNIWSWPIFSAWLTWLIHGLVDVPYFKNDLSILFFVLLGMTLISAKQAKINLQKS